MPAMILQADEMPIPGVEYRWKRSDGWGWQGEDRWWEVTVSFLDGMNGGGGACITELWRWNGSDQIMRQQPRNLTLQETRGLIGQLVEYKEHANVE